VTSRNTGRWILPKGNIERKEAPYLAAQREAFEESGVQGKVRKRPIGFYSYLKDGDRELQVSVHLLRVIRTPQSSRKLNSDRTRGLGHRLRHHLSMSPSFGSCYHPSMHLSYLRLRTRDFPKSSLLNTPQLSRHRCQWAIKARSVNETENSQVDAYLTGDCLNVSPGNW
jgi:8-oxo-dGTP pyrophosphatase MutT (NUDIX family)